MSALPDGSRASDYAYLRDVDRAGLMWEWLRRDRAYIGWYLRASAATGGRLPAPLRWHLLLAENPDLPAPRARILWRAELDPGALRIAARPTRPRDPDRLPLGRLRGALATVRAACGQEHAVLSDGLHHIRLGLDEGTLGAGPVALQARLHDLRHATARLATVRRLAAICRDGRFRADLFPADPHAERAVTLLRVADAMRAGASQRDVADILFGTERRRAQWDGASDALRSRVRRLIGDVRRLAVGGYRRLAGSGSGSDAPARHEPTAQPLVCGSRAGRRRHPHSASVGRSR